MSTTETGHHVLHDKVPVTVGNPYVAAQQLRVLLHTLLQRLDQVAAGGGWEDPETGEYQTFDVSPWLPPPWKSVLASYYTSTSTPVQNLRAFDVTLGQQLSLIERAARERKTKPILAAVAAIRAQPRRVQYDVIDKYRTRGASYLDSLPSKQPKQQPGQLGRDELERAYGLAQMLQTQPDLPVTPAENTLRAIIALLRNHKWPQMDGVTQKGEVMSDGKGLEEALAEVAAQAGTFEPVGLVGYDDEDGSSDENESDEDESADEDEE